MLLPVPGPENETRPKALEKAPESTAAANEETVAQTPRGKRPRVDWASLQRHTFGCDVWQCPCGGRRRVVAVVTSERVAEEVLRNMGLWQPKEPLPAAQGPPQRELVLDC